MRFYTYSAPATRDENQLREEVFQDYADCGLNVLMLTGENQFCGGVWKGSRTQKCFELAQKAGIKEIILDDRRIRDLSGKKQSLIGSDREFESEENLDEFVKTCLSDYIGEKLFLGLRLVDEPFADSFTACAETYRSIKRVAKSLGKADIYVHINLNPLCNLVYERLCPQKDKDIYTAYEEYIDSFLKLSGADLISVDNYPFKTDLYGGSFLTGYYACLQILSKKCREYGVKLAFVLQSFERRHKTKAYATIGNRRVLNINMMMLQMNSVLGFGAQDISFFTYNTFFTEENSAWSSLDGSAFITSDGEKTHIYELAKSAISYAQKLSDTLSSYSHVGANIYLHESVKNLRANYLGCGDYEMENGGFIESEFDNSYKPSCIEKVSFDKDILLVSEFESVDGNSLFTFQNVIDPIYKTDIRTMGVEIAFSREYGFAKVYDGEKFVVTPLENSVYKTQLSAGEAVWLIPIKA